MLANVNSPPGLMFYKILHCALVITPATCVVNSP